MAGADERGRDAGKRTTQLPLELRLRDDATLANFLPLPDTAPLLAALREQPSPAGEKLIYLYGPAGSGKSHLLQACCHEQGSAASACVSCHMRAETYMIVDPRRDHSFRVPRPDLSAALGSPNACNDCHDGETSDWAAARVAEWFPGGRSTGPHFGEAIAAARRWSADARVRLLGVLNDSAAPEIVRATALQLLAARRTQGDEAIIAASLEGDEPLLALGAIEAGAELPPERRVLLLQRYLDDERLIAVHAINSPREFMLSKKLIAQGARLDPRAIADVNTPFKTVAEAARIG